jgi:hypothetical protein
MSVKEVVTHPRPTKIFFQKPEKTDRVSEAGSAELDMGEASRLEGFRLNGCR